MLVPEIYQTIALDAMWMLLTLLNVFLLLCVSVSSKPVIMPKLPDWSPSSTSPVGPTLEFLSHPSACSSSSKRSRRSIHPSLGQLWSTAGTGNAELIVILYNCLLFCCLLTDWMLLFMALIIQFVSVELNIFKVKYWLCVSAGKQTVAGNI